MYFISLNSHLKILLITYYMPSISHGPNYHMLNKKVIVHVIYNLKAIGY